MRESAFEKEVISDLREKFKGCLILKNDSAYLQGIPDRLILFKDRWAALEFKKDAHAKQQPNQRWYVWYMNRLSYAAFIYPENKEEVMNELQRALRPGRRTRVSIGK